MQSTKQPTSTLPKARRRSAVFIFKDYRRFPFGFNRARVPGGKGSGIIRLFFCDDDGSGAFPCVRLIPKMVDTDDLKGAM